MRAALLAALALPVAAAPALKPIDEVTYDPAHVQRVAVDVATPTQVLLDDGETIASDPATGELANCQAPARWCLQWAPAGNRLSVKPFTTAPKGQPLRVEVVTSRRSISLEFVQGIGPAVRRLTLRLPKPPAPDPVQAMAAQRTAAALAMLPRPEELLEQRMAACPRVGNAAYSVAQGRGSDDIVPKAIFDDGRNTYLYYPNNRPIPTVFQVNPDGTEQMVNPRVECGDYLVVDRVARRLVVRLGSAVVAITNDGFDLDGRPPVAGTAVDGVERLVRNPRTGNFEEQAR